MSAEMNGSPHWYVVQCKSRQDARAEANLRNQHIPCYRPVRTVQAIRQGKRTHVEESLFPGYLFAYLCRLTDSWHTIRSTRGVLRLVTFANTPVAVEPGLIKDIKRRLEQHDERSLFKPGSIVRLAEGPFKDLDAIFSKADGAERAIVLLQILQRQQQLNVPLRIIRSPD
ncbi:MAG TPA: transcription/translation regulatory transformer protein RfaH [Pseudomonas xinjiangensis]|uniref:Transcription/translation regulatory transformer protein RfaH n=2 Tax=root TaxID=1 RepID=A0A7V1FTR4_9GAMM|nr:transcription/translation regulatory transformer protein RfaH [Halopseudomonas xinjiangensis]HEC47469.1 transcription/translation regulatory transformer protein RfaH [Halopseudomonas xinjiangensis]